MSSGSQSDTSLWLHNKLGTSNDSWTGGSIVSQLNSEILVKIQHCFQDLQPQVKLKLLLSFFHIQRRNLEEWRRELEDILAVARDDSEPWVCMLAELMKTFPESGQLCSDVSVPESNRKIFNDLAGDLKKALKKSSIMLAEGSRKEHFVLPLECHYLNKNAFMSVVGHQPQAIKHFNLRRKPKAAALRAELLNKSAEAANKVKTNTSAFPMRKSTMPRKMSDSTAAFKGIPSRTLATGGFNSRSTRMALNPNKKEGGVKLLDITEQPIGQAAMKKRKRQQELEDAKRFAEEAKADPNKPESGNTSSTAAKSFNDKETPDYAAGLSTLNPPTPAPPPAYAPPTPAYAPPTPSMPVSVANIVSTVVSLHQPPTVSTVLIQQPQLPTTPLPMNTTTPMLPTQPLPVTTARLSSLPMGLNQLQPLPQSALPSSTLVRLPTQPQPRATLATGTTARIVQLPTQPIPQNRVAQITSRQPPPVSILTNNLQPGARIIRTIQAPTSLTAPRQIINVFQQPIQQQQQQQQPPVPAAPQQAAQPGQPRKQNLVLTKEQMLEAQEMFRTANKVTRPEKALILGFMAGSRENPCPHLGNVVTIKLSENQESVLQNDGTYLSMIVETHFQMNYSSGEWKRIKKYRRLED